MEGLNCCLKEAGPCIGCGETLRVSEQAPGCLDLCFMKVTVSRPHTDRTQAKVGRNWRDGSQVGRPLDEWE